MVLAMSVALVLPSLIGLLVLSDFRQQEINQEIDAQLNEKIELLSHSLLVPIWNYDLKEATRIAEVVLADHQVVRISILDPTGKSLLHLERPDRRMGVSRIVRGQLISVEKVLGIVELEFDDSRSRHLFEQDRRIFLAVVMGQLLLAFLLILVVLRFGVLKPITQLIGFSNQLAAGDLDQPLDWNRDDEFGLLARQLDQMRRSVRTLLVSTVTDFDGLCCFSGQAA